MNTKKIIRFCYRKVIDAGSRQQWDQYVFDSTYNEFLLQSQLYNPGNKHQSFAAMLQQDPEAEKLHFLVSAAVTGYLQQLNGVIPDVVNDLGKHFLAFSQYRFEIINSDIANRQKHQVAVNFYSQPMQWLGTVHDRLIITAADAEDAGEGYLTETVQLRPFFTIHSIKIS